MSDTERRIAELEAFISKNDEQTEAELNVIKADRDEWRRKYQSVEITKSEWMDRAEVAEAEVARLRDERNQWREAALMQVRMDDIEASRKAIQERFGLEALRGEEE